MLNLKDLVFTCLALFSFQILSAQSVNDSLDMKLSAFAKNQSVVGFATSIIRDGEVKFINGYGLADEESKRAYTTKTIQNIASISKTFIGVSLMKAVEMKMLKLDDPIDKYLPYDIVNPKHPNQKITVRNLATHTSSLKDPDDYERAYIFEEKLNLNLAGLGRGISKEVEEMAQMYNSNVRVPLDDFIKSIFHPSGKYYSKKNFLKSAPGEKFSYSNIGAGMAARIIEIASGKSFQDFTQEYIFDPIGMNNSTWDLAKADRNLKSTPYIKTGMPIPHYDLITFADGGLITSIEDLSKYILEMMNCYLGKGKLLTKAQAKEMMTPYLPDSKEKYGIFWEISQSGLSIGHNGGDPGTMTNMYFIPSMGIAKIMFTNSPPIDKDGGEALSNVWRTLRAYEKKVE